MVVLIEDLSMAVAETQIVNSEDEEEMLEACCSCMHLDQGLISSGS